MKLGFAIAQIEHIEGLFAVLDSVVDLGGQ